MPVDTSGNVWLYECMAVTLYKRQRQIVDFIKQFIQKNGFSPTLQEIADAIGVSSLATVHEHLQALIKKKVIKRYEGAIRGLEVIENKLDQMMGSVEIPVLGFFGAGQPIHPFSDPEATMKIAPWLISGKKRAFILQVKGSSMIEEGIHDRDYVIIEEESITSVRDGDIVVALLDNGLATLKRFFREKTRVRLEPANSTMSPIFATNVRIQGKCVGVIRKY